MAVLPPRVLPWHLMVSLAITIAIAIAAAPPSAAQHQYVEGQHYWFKPATFPGTAAPSQQQGAGKAKGAVIWNDGYSPDKPPAEKVAPVAQVFAEAGWDVFNLQRHTLVHGNKGLDGVASIILTGIERVRALGYQRVILLGQSRGAFGSIQAAAQHPKIDGILALAPGWTADYAKSSEWRRNDFDIRPYWDKYAGTTYRIAAAFFENDDLYETKEPHVRGPYARSRLTELGVTNFILDQPKYAGMTGHHGGTSWEFARRFGPCLVHFFEAGKAPSCMESDAATASIFGITLPNQPDGNGYAGLWQGTWPNGRFLALAIQPPVNGRYSAVYWQGMGVNGDKAQSNTWSLVEKGGELLQLAAVEFRMHLEANGQLRVIRTDGRVPGKESDPPVYFTRAGRR